MDSYSLLVATYFIAFCCYAAHLPGQEGTIEHVYNVPGGPTRPASAGLHQYFARNAPPFELAAGEQVIVLNAIRKVCDYKNWPLHAAHVRTNHVHTVVSSDRAPELVMNAFKAYASRALNREGPSRPRWARHGSTRHLWSKESVEAAVRYVLEKQGDPMACYAGL